MSPAIHTSVLPTSLAPVSPPPSTPSSAPSSTLYHRALPSLPISTAAHAHLSPSTTVCIRRLLLIRPPRKPEQPEGEQSSTPVITCTGGILLVMATGVGIDCYFRFNKQAEELIKANTLLWEEIKEYDKKRDQEAKEAKEGEMSEGVFREKLLSEIKRIADSVNPPLSAAPSPPQV